MEKVTMLEFLGTQGYKSNFMIMDEKGKVRAITIPWHITGYSFYKEVKPGDKFYVSYYTGSQHKTVDWVGEIHHKEQNLD